MKKYILRVIMFFFAGSMSVGLTSCDENTLSTILDILDVITNLTEQTGESYTYSVNGKVTPLVGDPNTGYTEGTTKFFSGQVKVAVAGTSNNATATLTLPAVSVDGFSMSTVTLSGLELKASSSYTTIDVPDGQMGVDGTVTVDGKKYEISALWMEDCNLTSEEMAFGLVQVFFGDGQEIVISFSDLEGTSK